MSLPWDENGMAIGKIKQSTEDKWGLDIAKSGFTILPNHLVAYNQFVPTEEQLSPTAFLIICQILLHWWGGSDMPFPSKATLARRSGLSPRQVQRALGELESKGIIQRVARFGSNNKGRLSNRYDLEPLVRKLSKIAGDHPTIYLTEPETIKAPA
jgi:hypothetical protein